MTTKLFNLEAFRQASQDLTVLIENYGPLAFGATFCVGVVVRRKSDGFLLQVQFVYLCANEIVDSNAYPDETKRRLALVMDTAVSAVWFNYMATARGLCA